MLKYFLLLTALSCSGAENNTRDQNELIRTQVYEIFTHTAKFDKTIQNKEPIDPEKINYYLYTRKNRESYIKFDCLNPDKLNNKNVRIVFIIHGWLQSSNASWYKGLRNAFLNLKDEYYVLETDWSAYSNDDYVLSAYYTEEIGEIIGKCITNLYNNYKISLDEFLILGHSLGAQITGFIGKTVQNITSNTLPRIIGLDPAGPLFNHRPTNKKLSKYDAKIVQVIHTNGGTFGYLQSCGSIDFFPNGGMYQPGCARNVDFNSDNLVQVVTCSHSRAYLYFIEAVGHNDKFRSKSIGLRFHRKSVAMGNLEINAAGNFELQTNLKSPYSK